MLGQGWGVGSQIYISFSKECFPQHVGQINDHNRMQWTSARGIELVIAQKEQNFERMAFSARNFIIVYPAQLIPLSMGFTGAHIQYPSTQISEKTCPNLMILMSQIKMSFDITYIFSATCCLQRKTYSEERSEQRKRGNEIYELETETLQTQKNTFSLFQKKR